MSNMDNTSEFDVTGESFYVIDDEKWDQFVDNDRVLSQNTLKSEKF